MRKIRALLSLAAAGIALSGCEGAGSNCVRLALNAQYCLSSAPGPRFDTEQASVVSHAGKPVQLITRIRSDEDGLRFAGITPLGQTLVQVASGRDGVSTQLAPGLAEKVDGTMFLALVQLAVWPADEVRKGLRGKLTLDETPQARAVMQDGKPLVMISWEGSEPPFDKLTVEIPSAGVRVESRKLDSAQQ
jgi:Protein of unknown function (DUF3261)